MLDPIEIVRIDTKIRLGWHKQPPIRGDKIRIIDMVGESNYTGREGIVTYIDDAGGIHGTWGGLALLEEDKWEIING